LISGISPKSKKKKLQKSSKIVHFSRLHTFHQRRLFHLFTDLLAQVGKSKSFCTIY